MNCTNIKTTVREIFSEYIERKGQRKTPERFAVLDEVYGQEGHFDVEELYIHMKNKNHRVSRATLYNTMELLQDCGLVVKHQFGKNIAQYEKAHLCKQHDHIICTTCGRVDEYCDPRIHEIEKTVANIMKYDISHHSLYFYGTCITCQKTRQT